MRCGEISSSVVGLPTDRSRKDSWDGLITAQSTDRRLEPFARVRAPHISPGDHFWTLKNWNQRRIHPRIYRRIHMRIHLRIHKGIRLKWIHLTLATRIVGSINRAGFRRRLTKPFPPMPLSRVRLCVAAYLSAWSIGFAPKRAKLTSSALRAWEPRWCLRWRLHEMSTLQISSLTAFTAFENKASHS